MLDTEHTSHTTYRIAYHFCYIPKYRKMVLKKGLDTDLWKLNEQIASHYDMKILEQEIMPDHVHLLVSAPPRLAPSRIAQIFKSISARELFKKHPELRKDYWGGKLWTDSYFVETVGSKRLDSVKDYIRNQRQMTMNI
ncbi:MAG: IS200/IS605 family transposase [Candidatus Peribacteraceae bacterium]|jgi:putative transposase